jgi:hypothetical protein
VVGEALAARQLGAAPAGLFATPAAVVREMLLSSRFPSFVSALAERVSPLAMRHGDLATRRAVLVVAPEAVAVCADLVSALYDRHGATSAGHLAAVRLRRRQPFIQQHSDVRCGGGGRFGGGGGPIPGPLSACADARVGGEWRG